MRVPPALSQRESTNGENCFAPIPKILLEDTPIYTCNECDREFTRYDTPGKCPVCGEWAKLECSSCGYKGGAKQFYEGGCKCPKCGQKTRVPGAEFNLWILVAVLAVIGAIGGAIYLYVQS